MNEEVLLYFLVFVVSISIGSFINVVIYRVPKKENVMVGRSYCPNCNNQLKWYHNFPLFSWIFLKAKCGFCKQKISIQYPLVEFFVGILGLLSFHHYGLTYNSIFLFLSLTTFFTVAVIDFKYKLVPNFLSFLAYIFAIASSSNYIDSLSFSMVFLGVFSMLRIVGEIIFNKEIMGEGDLLIGAIIGALLPTFQESMTAVIITAIIALIPSLYTRIKSKNESIDKNIDSRFLKLENEINSMLELDKEDPTFQYKINIFKDGIDNMKYKEIESGGIPFVPFLFLGLIITFFTGVNLYI